MSGHRLIACRLSPMHSRRCSRIATLLGSKADASGWRSWSTLSSLVFRSHVPSVVESSSPSTEAPDLMTHTGLGDDSSTPSFGSLQFHR